MAGPLLQPSGKVLCHPGGLYEPQLVWNHQRVWLGVHAREPEAAAAYDLAKLLLVRKEGGEDESFEGLKLHRPAAAYTSHPLWEQLSSEHCTFEEACSLLAAGVAAELVKQPRTAGRQPRRREGQAPRQQQQQEPGRQGGALSLSGSGDEGDGRAGGGGGGSQRRARGKPSDRWQGLPADGSSCYSVRLTPSLTRGGSDTTIPADYLQAIAGTTQLPLTLTVTTPDGLQHSWPVRWYAPHKAYYLGRIGGTVTALGSKAGDRLCFKPTGPAAAEVWLQREPAGADKQAGAAQQQQQQQGAGGSSGRKRPRDAQHAGQPSSGSEGSDSGEGSDELSGLNAGRLSGGVTEPERVPSSMPPPAGSARQQQVHSGKWSGLDPQDLRRYCMRVSASLAPPPGKKRSGNTSIPWRYLKAVSGCKEAPGEVLLTAPDGRQRACAVRRHSGSYYLTVGSLAALLGAAEGDTLCFTPTGEGAAAVQLLKAPTAVAAGAATRAQAAAAAAADGTASAAPATAAAGAPGADELEPGESDGESDGESGSGPEEQPDPEESAGLEQLGTTEGGSQEHSLVSGSEYEPVHKRRRRRQREGSGSAGGSKPVGASVNWSGLEEGQVDRGVYTLTLPAAAFKSGGNLKIQTPARYLKMLFGEEPKEGRPATAIQITALGSTYTCGMALYSRRRGCVLLGVGLGSLLASLGASLGDQLQLRPAGGRVAHAVLVKPASAVQVPGAPAAAAAAAAAPPAAERRSQQLKQPQQPRQGPAAAALAGAGCTHCGSPTPGPPGTRGYTWRRHPSTGSRLCGPCGQYAGSHGGALRPLAQGLKQQGQQAQQQDVEEDEWEEEQDLEEEEEQEQEQKQEEGEEEPSRQQHSSAAPARRQRKRGGAPTNWRGLEPVDVGRYLLVLSPHVVEQDHRACMPERYAAAAFGQSLTMLNQSRVTVTITTPADGRTHRLTLAARGPNESELRGLRSLLASLGAAAGDQLCLEPSGPLAATATLIPAVAAAAGAGLVGQSEGQQQQQQEQPGSDEEEADGDDDDDEEEEQQGSGAWQGEEQQQPGNRQGGFASNWRELGPPSTGCYAATLPCHTVHKEYRLWIPERYAAAVFGQSPRQLSKAKLTAAATEDGRTHRLTLAARHGTSNQLTGMRSLLASLGAAAGDQLCFRPAGSLAAEVSLLKAAVAPAAAGGGPPGSAGPAAQHFVDADEVEAEADGGMEEGEAFEDDEDADVAMEQGEWEDQDEEPQLPLQPQKSPGVSTAGAGATAGSGAGRLPGKAVQQEGTAAVWAEMRQLLEAAEEHGCLPPGSLADYRAKFEALPTHAERLEHRTALKALVDAGLWDTVKRRIRLALLP